MIDSIAIFLLGAITVVIPLVIYYLRLLGAKFVADCQKTRQDLDKTLADLNQLHNNALITHKSLENRIIKLETTNAAQTYGVSRK